MGYRSATLSAGTTSRTKTRFARAIGCGSRLRTCPSSPTDRAGSGEVKVRLFATLAAFLPAHGRDGVADLEIPEGSTVADVAHCLGIPPDLARVVLVNGCDIGSEAHLAACDVVTIFPPLAGGSVSRAAAEGGAPTRRAEAWPTRPHRSQAPWRVRP